MTRVVVARGGLSLVEVMISHIRSTKGRFTKNFAVQLLRTSLTYSFKEQFLSRILQAALFSMLVLKHSIWNMAVGEKHTNES